MSLDSPNSHPRIIHPAPWIPTEPDSNPQEPQSQNVSNKNERNWRAQAAPAWRHDRIPRRSGPRASMHANTKFSITTARGAKVSFPCSSEQPKQNLNNSPVTKKKRKMDSTGDTQVLSRRSRGLGAKKNEPSGGVKYRGYPPAGCCCCCSSSRG